MAGANPTYVTIQTLLDKAIGGGAVVIGAHQAFWRTMTRDQFVAANIFGLQLIKPKTGGGFDTDGSALVQAVEARPPFGSDVGTAGAHFRRMPAGKAAMSAADIATIRAWIGAGCPV